MLFTESWRTETVFFSTQVGSCSFSPLFFYRLFSNDKYIRLISQASGQHYSSRLLPSNPNELQFHLLDGKYLLPNFLGDLQTYLIWTLIHSVSPISLSYQSKMKPWFPLAMSLPTISVTYFISPKVILSWSGFSRSAFRIMLDGRTWEPDT